MKPDDQGRARTGCADNGGKEAGAAPEKAANPKARVADARPASSVPASGGGNAGRSGQVEERTFNRWLARKLNQLYGGFGSQPPESLLRIIEHDRRKKS